MLKELRFAIYSIKKNIQSSAELRTSFVMNIIGMMVNNVAFIALWVFFVQSVGEIGGWNAADVVGLQAYTALVFGVVFSLALGLRHLPEYVSSGAFDRFMLSPKNLLVRTGTADFSPSAVGDILFGLIVFVIYSVIANVTLMQIAFMAILAVFATVTFLAMVILIFSTSFLFVDSRYVSNGLFELFFTPSLFHGGAIQGVMRFVFTFLVPSLLIGTLPVEAIRELSLSTLIMVGVLSLVWLGISIAVFYRLVRKYESSGFMTFGH